MCCPIVKQLNDIGRLFYEIRDISIIIDAFNRTAGKEIIDGNYDYNCDNLIRDLPDTVSLIARWEGNKDESDVRNFKKIQKGYKYAALRSSLLVRMNMGDYSEVA
jgi:hypothetical protein